jgi:hypothetical protein
MVSDLAQTLERDNVFGNSEDHKNLVVREPEENEMVPNIIKEGKVVTEFDPEFFIVSISHGMPKEHQDYTIMKNYDFLGANRQMKPNKNDLVNYIRAHKNDNSSVKFANFNFLLYIVRSLDIDTVCAIAQKVANEEQIEDYLVELVESMV